MATKNQNGKKGRSKVKREKRTSRLYGTATIETRDAFDLVNSLAFGDVHAHHPDPIKVG